MNAYNLTLIDRRLPEYTAPLINTSLQRGVLRCRELVNRFSGFTQAFTLIELLAVTFTMGMLALLVLPALAKSKSKATGNSGISVPRGEPQFSCSAELGRRWYLW